MAVFLLNGVVADTPDKLTDEIRVSVPDLTTTARLTYGPLKFDPVVSGSGGVRIPNRGDKAVLGIDEETGDQWIVRWHRDDLTLPPYTESGVVPDTGDKNYVHTQSAPNSIWNVVHGLGKYPAVDVVDTGGSVIIPNVAYVDLNNVQLTFGSATSGKAYVN